jgi:hypothetical protein
MIVLAGAIAIAPRSAAAATNPQIVSYRKIILGGVADARTVLVPPVGLVDA